MDWIITLAIIGLNLWVWFKTNTGIGKKVLLTAVSCVFLFWYNYASKWGWFGNKKSTAIDATGTQQ